MLPLRRATRLYFDSRFGAVPSDELKMHTRDLDALSLEIRIQRVLKILKKEPEKVDEAMRTIVDFIVAKDDREALIQNSSLKKFIEEFWPKVTIPESETDEIELMQFGLLVPFASLYFGSFHVSPKEKFETWNTQNSKIQKLKTPKTIGKPNLRDKAASRHVENVLVQTRNLFLYFNRAINSANIPMLNGLAASVANIEFPNMLYETDEVTDENVDALEADYLARKEADSAIDEAGSALAANSFKRKMAASAVSIAAQTSSSMASGASGDVSGSSVS